MSKTVVMAVVNQKGGTGKTTTCENLGIGLANEGKRVLLIDSDPQGSLTISLGYPRPDELQVTLTDIFTKIIKEEEIAPGEGIIKHEEGVDLMPANIELSGLEVSLVNVINREKILKQYVDSVKDKYDFILIDCGPSLGMLTINALAAADRLIIPVQAQYLPAKGLELLLQTVNKVRKHINPGLKIEGILLTMVDSRTNYAKDISNLIRNECANIGQIPNLEKLVATIRSREISACLILQAKSQLKAIYKDNADTIVGNMDSQLFLGGTEPSTLKDLNQMLGKETIDMYNTGESRGNNPSYSMNYQKTGHELLSVDELAVMDGEKCILQLRGVRPFLSDKYDLTKHPNYRETADYDKRNFFDVEKYVNRKLRLKPDDEYDVIDMG